MSILKIIDSQSIRISVTPDKTRVRLRFGTASAGPYESIEFELESIVALAVAEEIRKLIPPVRSIACKSTASDRSRVSIRKNKIYRGSTLRDRGHSRQNMHRI